MRSPEHAAGPRPRLSVLLPCRNAADTLPAAIDGLRAQERRDFEVIVVDDGSSDDTRRILDGWAAEDPRIRVLATPAGARGIVHALDLAASAASAPLVGRMDADDIAAPERFALQLEFMAENPGLAACGAHVELFGNAPDVGPGYRRYEAWINSIETPADVERAALVECPIAHPTLVIRRSVLNGVGGYRDTKWPEDYDLILRLLSAGTRMANLPGRPLLRWRVRNDRLSLTDPRYSAQAFRHCKAHFLVERFLPADRPVVVWGAGRVGKPLGRELIRQGRSVTAFIDLDPRKIGQEIHGAPVWTPEEFAEHVAVARALPYVLPAVGSPGVRGEIREALEEASLVEIDDYRFCA